MLAPAVSLPEKSRLGCYITVKMTDLEGSEVGRLQVEIPTEKIKEEITAEPLGVTETEFEITAEGFKPVFTGFLRIFINAHNTPRR